jgi:hypothetical protein
MLPTLGVFKRSEYNRFKTANRFYIYIYIYNKNKNKNLGWQMGNYLDLFGFGI